MYAPGIGIAIVEFKNLKQLANRIALGAPDVFFKLMPLILGSMIQESLEKHGK